MVDRVHHVLLRFLRNKSQSAEIGCPTPHTDRSVGGGIQIRVFFFLMVAASHESVCGGQRCNATRKEDRVRQLVLFQAPVL